MGVLAAGVFVVACGTAQTPAKTAPGAAHSTVKAKYLSLSASAGDDVVHIGQRIVLAIDIDLPKGMQVYAPGVKGYRHIDFAIAESPSFSVHDAVYPESKKLTFKAIYETVPVYSGQVRVLRDITIAKGVQPGELTVEGKFRYQACDDRQCFLPETVPLKWVLRVPSEIQHKQEF